MNAVASSNAVELEGVTKRFGRHVAVDRLDLAVPEGSVYGFIGPNGSGKTTTLRMILRILYPESGRVAVLGRGEGSVADDRVGYLPEERGLYKRMKVHDLLTYYARLKGFWNCRGEIDQWLERFGLDPWARQRADALSKGMAQKVQFISAVVARPRLLVLDEPFTGLDPLNMEALKDAVLMLNRNGATVIFSTHDMDIAERMCDTIFMIYRGRKVLDGTLAAIQSQYGRDTLRVRMGDGAEALQDLPGVLRVNDYGRYTELRIKPQADTQAILRELLGRGRIEHFELAQPSLHDIFVRIAGDGAKLTGEDAPVYKILVIANREFRAIVGTKAFLIVITLMPVLMFGGIAVQKMLEGRVGPVEKKIAVLDGTGVLFESLAAAAQSHNEHEIFDPASGKQIKPRLLIEAGPAGEATEETRFQLSERIRRREIDAFLEIPAGIDRMPAAGEIAKANLYAENAAMMDEQGWLGNALSNAVRLHRLKAANIDPTPVDRAGAPVIVEPLGLVARSLSGEFSKPRETNIYESFFLPFGMMMLMFMTIFLAAQPMLESVLEEKSQRIAEVLLGSVNALQLMAGKLLGGVGGSLTVVVTYAAGALAAAWYFDVLHLVPLRIVPWFLAYQILAVMMFGSLFMAVGATCNQLKEAQGMLMPIWLLMMFPLFVWIQVVRDPTGTFGTWLSFVPPATPLLMVLRLGASAAVPWWQPALGILVMLAATWLCVFAAARIFRIGILAQGKTPKLRELLRWAVRG